MQQQRHISSLRKIMVIWCNKKNNNSLATEPKGTDYCNLIDKKFKTAVMKRFNELQENSERQLNELRSKMNE